jgi:hypothetical protein
MGTPAYMSPEQCRGAGHVDQRSDVYALGCMLFALITGSPPFVAEGSGDVIAMHLREPPPAPSSRLFGVPPEIDALVLRCLVKDPAQRFASATELAMAIGEIAGSASSPNWRTGRAGQPPIGNAIASTTLSLASGAPGPFARSRTRRLAFAAIAALLVGGTAAVVVSRGGGRTAPVEPAPVPPAVVARPQPPPPAPVTPRPPSPPDPSAELAGQMTQVLARFTAWSKDHAGAACPGAAELGDPVLDPWGKPLAITCTDQPANQIVGVISAGPDGEAGTADDIGSWQLPRDVTDRVRGARWRTAAPPPPPRPPPAPPPARPRPHRDAFDDIPTQR